MTAASSPEDSGTARKPALCPAKWDEPCPLTGAPGFPHGHVSGFAPRYSTIDLPLDYFQNGMADAMPVGSIVEDGDAGTWMKTENEWIEL